MNQKFTPKAERVLRRSAEVAGEMGHTYIGSEHLLLALAEEGDGVAAGFLESHAADGAKLRRAITDYAGLGTPTAVFPTDMTPRLRQIIERSSLVHREGGSPIGTEHLLSALLNEGDAVGVRLLSEMGVNVAELRSEIEGFLEESEELEEKKKGGEPLPTAGLTYLGQYGRDLNRQAREGKQDPLIGREAELARTMRILCRRTKNNPCLIGEPGVGKTAIAEGLAARIVAGNVPEALKDKTVVLLDLSAMIAGAKYRGEFEDRMRGVLEETRKNPRLILFIDEIHIIVGAGAAEGAIDAANILKPALARGEVRLIGATTIREYRLHIEKDAALTRRFEQVTVEEPTAAEAEEILRGLAEKYEAHHRLRIGEDAVSAAVRLSVRYLPDRYLPDKALDLLDEAAAELRMEADKTPRRRDLLQKQLEQLSEEKLAAIRAQQFEAAAALRDEERRLHAALLEEERREREKTDPRPVLTAEQVARVVTRRTGIPTDLLFREAGDDAEKLSALLSERVVGQEQAIASVVSAVCRRRAGVSDPHRPVGCFLFIGPTGVGKTALARALAEYLFGGDEALIRLDMSEFMEKHSVARLIGAPPGYVGYEEGGALVERIRRRPYAVLLFDEIEKAHPDVMSLLLQMMEDGRLTDSGGRRADLSHALIILTSNAGVTEGEEARPLGFTADARQEETKAAEAALRRAFRPEFLNRLDEIVRFRSLAAEDMRRIARIFIADLAARLAEGGTSLRVTDEAVEALCAHCSAANGDARELRRILARELEDGISSALLTGRIKRGSPVVAELCDGRIRIGGAEQENPAGG